MELVFLTVSFLASVVGAICGVGGGVIIKPVLDFTGLASVSTISFLSGCTVIAMSGYSVIRNVFTGDSRVDYNIGTPLAVGAAVGGIAGKYMFTYIKSMFDNPEAVGRVQAFCLAIITIAALLYTLSKEKIKSRNEKNAVICFSIGIFLGITSSFLGIGGGPINLIVLFFFFSMDAKTAAQNSLYVILFSQIAALLTTIFTNTVPEFNLSILGFMVLGGIGGGIIGRVFYKRMSNKAVDKLFVLLMDLIIFISFYNTFK